MSDRRSDKAHRKTSGNWGENLTPQVNYPQTYLVSQLLYFTAKTLNENEELKTKLEGFGKLETENKDLKAQLFEKIDHSITRRFGLAILLGTCVLPLLIGIGYAIGKHSP